MLSTLFSSSRCFCTSRSSPLFRLRSAIGGANRAAGFSARSISTSLPDLPFFRTIHRQDPNATAVVHSDGTTFTYGSLVADVSNCRDRLLREQSQTASSESVAGDVWSGKRVTFLAPNSYDYIVGLLSIWATDAIAVPMSPSFALAESRYIIEHCRPDLMLSTDVFGEKAQEIVEAVRQDGPKVPLSIKESIQSGAKPLEDVSFAPVPNKGGLMLYTSGTTSRPKGVVIPHSALAAQGSSLLKAWEYTPADRVLHVLPLNHIHGIVNAILAPLMAGSSIEFMFPFNAQQALERFAAPFLPGAAGANAKDKITLFTGVPTHYYKLMEGFNKLNPDAQKAAKTAISPQNLRLNMAGSAALPAPMKQSWSTISNGNELLERYGMTEIGMAISCGLDHRDRVSGSVGWPLPSVDVRLVDVDTNEPIELGEEVDPESGRERVGEIQVRGPTIFKEYFANDKATQETFAPAAYGGGDNWFKTGDVAVRRHVKGLGDGSTQDWCRGPLYFIQGRISSDIIKAGGEKVSALEVERELLSLNEVDEAAVVALPSEKFGEVPAAAVVLNAASSKLTPLGVRELLKPRLAKYKLPHKVKVVERIPRNAMGKIMKKDIQKIVFGQE